MASPKGTEGTICLLFIRITDGEKAIIKDRAKKAGLTMSEYMRRTSLHKRIRANARWKEAAGSS